MRKLKFLVILAIIFMIGKTDVVDAFDFEGKIHKNVYVGSIDLSQLTKKQAVQKINSYISDNRYLVLTYKNEEITIDKNKLEVDYKVEELVDKAYNVGRNQDIISNIKTKVSLNKGNKEIITLSCSYSTSKLDNLVDEIHSKFYVYPVDATAKIIDDEIIVTKGRVGQTINRDRLKDIIVYQIENLELEKTEIPIEVVKPKYTYSQLKKIDTLLGSYETFFNPKNQSRANNICVATNSTDNIIVDTNEKFSFNTVLENKNARSKLKEAPIILNGKQDKGLGGGICQVSTTIYNAALYAGMNIVEVNNHSIPSFYIKKGRDATVSNGYIDFVFKNEYKTPVIIHNQIFDNKIVSKIYGSSEDKKNIEIETEIVKVIKNKKIYQSAPNLEKGTKVVEQKGRLGYTVNTFRLYKLDGEVLKKELINTSDYPPCDEIILNGTRDNSVCK